MPYIIGGWSMGAGITTEVALQSPQKLKGMVLILPSTAWETRAAQQFSYGALSLLSHLHIFKQLFPALLRFRPFVPDYIENAFPGMTDIINKYMVSHNEDMYPHLLMGASKSDYRKKSEIAQIQCPTFISTWKGDHNHPLSTAFELHKLIANSKLYVAETAEDFMSWTDKLSNFLDDILKE